MHAHQDQFTVINNVGMSLYNIINQRKQAELEIISLDKLTNWMPYDGFSQSERVYTDSLKDTELVIFHASARLPAAIFVK